MHLKAKEIEQEQVQEEEERQLGQTRPPSQLSRISEEAHISGSHALPGSRIHSDSSSTGSGRDEDGVPECKNAHPFKSPFTNSPTLPLSPTAIAPQRQKKWPALSPFANDNQEDNHL